MHNRNTAVELNAMLNADDNEFIRLAYSAILNRKPDSEGEISQLRKLSSGVHKLVILQEMRFSEEGMGIHAEFPALDEAIRKFQIERRCTLAEQRELLDKILSADGRDFISLSYQNILGRNPDPDGMNLYRNHMAMGLSKLHVLAALRTSAEGRSHRRAFHVLDAMLRQNELIEYDSSEETQAVYNELMHASGIDFVHKSYQMILLRDPDSVGESYYLRRWYSGYSRLHILKQICKSPGADSGDALKKVHLAIEKYTYTRIPIVGSIFKWMYGSSVEADGFAERQLRSIERQLDELRTARAHEIEHIGRSIERMKSQIKDNFVKVNVGVSGNETGSSTSSSKLTIEDLLSLSAHLK